jgi:hypothetical protein
MSTQSTKKELKPYLAWTAKAGDLFAIEIASNLARYPVPVEEFITSDAYLGLKNVYPVVIEALTEIYHPEVEGLERPLRIGTPYREILLSGSIGCAKTYTSVLGILYGIYLLSCLRSPHKLFGLDPSSEIVIIFQSIRFQTGGVAYKLAREIIEGSHFFTKAFPKDPSAKNEIRLPHNIKIIPLSGEQTAAIGMNVVTALLDEMSYMKYHTKSVYAEDGGEYDQAKALYSSTLARIDSRFAKLGRYLIPVWLAGSARHEGDFIQAKMREVNSSSGHQNVYIYNKTLWQLKPWDYPSGKTFRVFLGKESVPPQIVGSASELYESEHVIDVPFEIEAPFRSQPIHIALRDFCGIPSAETGNFIVEVERVKSFFSEDNFFWDASTNLRDGWPKLRKVVVENLVTHRPWFCHLDLSRTHDSTGLALGYVDRWIDSRPQIVVSGILRVDPVEGHVIPWEAIMCLLYKLSQYVPLRAVSADQVGYHYLAEHLVPYGFKIAKISDNPSSDPYHKFLNTLMEGSIRIAKHDTAMAELLALDVDEKTGKVSKPAGGSKDCIDAVVGLVELIKLLPPVRHDLSLWPTPSPPETKKLPNGEYQLASPVARTNPENVPFRY